MVLLAAVWLLICGLGDAAVVVHSTAHNRTATTLAIACGMVAADVVVTGFFAIFVVMCEGA